MHLKLFSFLAAGLGRRSTDQVCCYHCGESMRRGRIVNVDFNGARRDVCCHGCAAILNAIDMSGLCAEYLDAKSNQASK